MENQSPTRQAIAELWEKPWGKAVVVLTALQLVAGTITEVSAAWEALSPWVFAGAPIATLVYVFIRYRDLRVLHSGCDARFERAKEGIVRAATDSAQEVASLPSSQLAMWSIDRLLVRYEQLMCEVRVRRIQPAVPPHTKTGKELSVSIAMLLLQPTDLLASKTKDWIEDSRNAVATHFGEMVAHALQAAFVYNDLNAIEGALLERKEVLDRLREQAFRKLEGRS